MSSKHLGEQFDIHTGGEDHIPIHHTNEIAQSEAAFGKKPWVNYWIHWAFLTFKGEKVSKSKGGLYTLSELEEKKFIPLAYRYFVLTGHYRTQLEFSIENLENSQNSYQRLKNIISELKDDGKENARYIDEFEKAINDDLNTPQALQVLWKLVRDEKASGKYSTIKKMDLILGLDLLKIEKIKISSEVQKLLKEREEARKKKDFKKSDELRDKINKLGYKIDDSSEGTKVSKL
jgi:cysteinyl-tRNA synthetase